MVVHQVRGRLVNSYVVEDGQRMFVVDVAIRGEKYVLGFIEEVLHRSAEEVDLVISTHDDPDHIGGVTRLAAHCDAKVCYPYAAFARLTKLSNDPAGILFRIASGCVEAFRGRCWDMYLNRQRNLAARNRPMRLLDKTLLEQQLIFEPDYRLKNGNLLPGFAGWTVMHTPGHSWDSCCFYHGESRSLISGDTLLGSGKKGIVVTPSIYSNPFQLSRTIERIKELQPKAIYPGHGSHLQGGDLLGHL